MGKPSNTNVAAAVAIRSAAHWLKGGRRNALVALGCIGLLTFAASEAWRQYGVTHAHFETYSVAADDLHLTPPPPWVRANIQPEVVQLGALDRLSLLDRDATRRVAEACALHPWVSRVHRVTKHYPAAIHVDVLYRKPVAVVQVERDGVPGLLPVDRDGILLPPEDFTTAQVKALPRIAVENTFPVAAVGTSWGDDRVAAAALIAEVLCDDWAGTELFQIVPLPPVVGGLAEATSFEIVDRQGRKFPWGKAPGRESSGEKTAAQKKSDLLAWLKTKLNS